MAELAALRGISLRTGCFCNPGACQAALRLSPTQLDAFDAAGKSCGDDRALLDGVPTGAVRPPALTIVRRLRRPSCTLPRRIPRPYHRLCRRQPHLLHFPPTWHVRPPDASPKNASCSPRAHQPLPLHVPAPRPRLPHSRARAAGAGARLLRVHVAVGGRRRAPPLPRGPLRRPRHRVRSPARRARYRARRAGGGCAQWRGRGGKRQRGGGGWRARGGGGDLRVPDQVLRRTALRRRVAARLRRPARARACSQ